MDEKEALGKVAYETYYKDLGLSPELWDTEPSEIQQVWINVANAVTERVFELQRIAAEASE